MDFTDFIGIDECYGDGKNLLLYMAVHSKNPKHIEEKELGKKRNKTHKTYNYALSKIQNYRFLITYENKLALAKEEIGYLTHQSLVLSTLINSFEKDIDLLKTKIFIDGEPNKRDKLHLLKQTKFFVAEHYKKEKIWQDLPIEFIKKADLKYELVNIADALAWRYWQTYKNIKEGQEGLFDDKRIFLDLY